VQRQNGSESSDLPYFTIEQARQFKSLFGFLNEKDRDILYLIFVSRKKQKDVQWILNRSQSSLCYDIKRIRRRLKFISYLHNVFDIFLNFIRAEEERRARARLREKSSEEQETDFVNECFSAQEIEVLTLMFYTSSFTLTAKIMRVSQVKVRYIYNRCLRRIEEIAMWEELNPSSQGRNGGMRMWEVYEIFLQVRSNLNIIRRVCRRWRKNYRPFFIV
jgi:DNA-directed RNA polymerase specialized sigma subunit